MLSSRSASRGNSAQILSSVHGSDAPPRLAAVATRFSQHGEIGKHLPAFRHQADAELADAIGRPVADRLAGEADRARHRRRQPHDRAHGRGLAHAVAAHQRHHLAGRDGERDAEQHLAAPVAGLDAVDLEQRVSHGRPMTVLLAEIGLAHLLVGADRRRLARRDDAAVDQHADAVREREHRVHVVLDQEDRQVALELAQQRDHAHGFLRAHAGHRLVEQQHARPGRERHRDLELAVLAMAHARHDDVLAARPARRAPASRARARASAASSRASRQKWNECPACACTASATLSSAVKSLNSEVIWNERASPRWLRLCTGSAVMSCAGEVDTPGVGRDLAGQLADQRGLAGAVRADDGVQLACRHREIDAVGGGDAAEALRQTVDGQAARQSRRRLSSSPLMPPRANSTTSRNSGPSTICQYSAAREAAAPTNGVATSLIRIGRRFFQHQQRDRADQRAEGRRHAAEHHHHDEIAGARPVHHRGTDELGVVGEQRAGEAAHGAGDDEAGEAVAIGREADRLHAAVVRARALDHHAEARVHDPPGEVDARDQQHEAPVVELRAVARD